MEVCTLKMSVLAETLEDLGFEVEELNHDMIGAHVSWDGGEIVITATPDEVTVERPTNSRYGTKTYRGKSVRFVKSTLERMMANDGFGDY